MKRFFGLTKFGMLAAPAAIAGSMLFVPGRLDGLLLVFLVAAPLGVAGFFAMSFLERFHSRDWKTVAVAEDSPNGPAGEVFDEEHFVGIRRPETGLSPHVRKHTDPDFAAVGMYGGTSPTGEYVERW